MAYVLYPYCNGLNRNFHCSSDLNDWTIKSLDRKGVTIDDTTNERCIYRMLTLWPHTGSPGDKKIKFFRIFQAWKESWEETQRRGAWENLIKAVVDNDAKILLGTSISCDEEIDKTDWRWAKEMIKLLGSKHILGIAVGNEIDLLHKRKETTQDCLDNIWGKSEYDKGYFFRALSTRMMDLEELCKDCYSIPFTTAFSSQVLDTPGFINTEEARVKKVSE